MDSYDHRMVPDMTNILRETVPLTRYQNALPPSLASLSAQELAAEIDRQCRLIAANPRDADDQAFIDALAE
ncbi:MAG: DUF3018 family protein [Candidatus Symbiobacter sp.]|nr:DUF3018 family protein [Candidatus Symbiobacter sp.]